MFQNTYACDHYIYPARYSMYISYMDKMAFYTYLLRLNSEDQLK